MAELSPAMQTAQTSLQNSMPTKPAFWQNKHFLGNFNRFNTSGLVLLCQPIFPKSLLLCVFSVSYFILIFYQSNICLWLEVLNISKLPHPLFLQSHSALLRSHQGLTKMSLNQKPISFDLPPRKNVKHCQLTMKDVWNHHLKCFNFLFYACPRCSQRTLRCFSLIFQVYVYKN